MKADNWTPEGTVATIKNVNEDQIPAASKGNPVVEPDVSIIIVNWNLKDYLLDCIRSVLQHGGDLSVEIIVVDNASSDDSAGAVAREFPQVTLIENLENVGFAAANNQAMAIGTGRYYFLLNNDALVYEGVLPSLVEFMDSHPDVGICGPRVVNGDGSLQVRAKGNYPSVRTALFHFFTPAFVKYHANRSRGFYVVKDDRWVRETDWVSGCAMMVNRAAVDEVGMLDADVFMYCEDVDWCYRMKKSGWKVFYFPEVTVLHYEGKSMKKQTGRKVGAHKAGLVAFYARHHGSKATMVFRAALWSGYGLQAAAWMLQAAKGQKAGLNKIKRLLGRHTG